MHRFGIKITLKWIKTKAILKGCQPRKQFDSTDKPDVFVQRLNKTSIKTSHIHALFDESPLYRLEFFFLSKKNKSNLLREEKKSK